MEHRKSFFFFILFLYFEIPRILLLDSLTSPWQSCFNGMLCDLDHEQSIEAFNLSYKFQNGNIQTFSAAKLWEPQQ